LRTRILFAGLLGCLALAVVPGAAMASKITPEGPFTAVAGKTTFSIPGAQYPGSATKGISITCTSSALHGTVKNVSTPNANPITPGAPTYSGCTSTSPFNAASVTAPAPRNMVIAEKATLITELKLKVTVGGCVMEFVGSEDAYYSTNSGPVTTIPFENAHNNSVFKMTKVPVGLACELTFGSSQTMTSTATYSLNPGLTVTIG
jgi:hypothetical protein